VIRTRVIEDFPSAEALRAEWSDLLARSTTPEPTSTPLWLFAWWREFGRDEGRELRVVVMEDAGSLIGVVPLSTRRTSYRGALPLRRIELLGRGEDRHAEICSEYIGPIVARGRERDVADAFARGALCGALGRWDEIVLPAMNGDDATLGPVHDALVEHGARVEIEPIETSLYIPLPSTWDGYLNALPGANRYVVTRALRELDAWAGAGGWSFVRAKTEADLEEGKRILHSLHAERWSAEGHGGAFENERFRRFHDDVMGELLRGRDGASLDLVWLAVKGEPVAANYGIVYEKKLSFYQAGRKLDVPKQVKVGIALHALSIRGAIEAKRTEYDFLGGDAQYKRQLGLAKRSLVTLRAVAPGPRARAIDAARALTERLAAEVRRHRKPTEVGAGRRGTTTV
jgi:CelD/BcsL family acetyltransferase involved in cellulose biosynthesis